MSTVMQELLSRSLNAYEIVLMFVLCGDELKYKSRKNEIGRTKE